MSTLKEHKGRFVSQIAGHSMSSKNEWYFAEVAVDRLLMESFSNEASAYFKSQKDKERDESYDQFRSKLRWHMSRSLSQRQKQVMKLTLAGKKQREIAELLGIKQQVVSIYKKRAINKLRKLMVK